MLATETRTVAGREVSVTKFGARRALRMTGKIGRIVGPALASTKGLSLSSSVEDLGPVASALFSQIDNAGFDDLLLELLATTVVIHEERRVELTSNSNIDKVFGDDALGLLKVAAFAVEVNFAGFIGELLDGLRKLKPDASPAKPGTPA